MIENTNAPKNAGKIPSIPKPFTNNAASANVNAFITSANRPNVIKVMGKENNLIIGLIKVLTSANTSVAIMSVVKSDIVIPETILAVRKRAIAFPIKDIK